MGSSSGRFVWYELTTSHAGDAKEFYASVVGWGTSDGPMPSSAYSQFTAGGAAVAGLMQLPPEASAAGVAAQWLGFVGVDDVDFVTNKVEKLGGTVHLPPKDVPNMTRFSIVADPQMAPIALVKEPKRTHHRPVPPGALGHIVWHELLASDLDRVFSFYSALLGWRKMEAQIHAVGTYQQFAAGTETIGGIFTRSDSPSMSRWLYYFNVADIAAAAKRVKASGGQVIYGPITLPSGARVVHCTDPQCVMFALIDAPVHIAIGCYAPRSGEPAAR